MGIAKSQGVSAAKTASRPCPFGCFFCLPPLQLISGETWGLLLVAFLFWGFPCSKFPFEVSLSGFPFRVFPYTIPHSRQSGRARGRGHPAGLAVALSDTELEVAKARANADDAHDLSHNQHLVLTRPTEIPVLYFIVPHLKNEAVKVTQLGIMMVFPYLCVILPLRSGICQRGGTLRITNTHILIKQHALEAGMGSRKGRVSSGGPIQQIGLLLCSPFKAHK